MQNHKNTSPLRFAITFIVLFLVFYYFNIAFFGATIPGGKNYIHFLDKYLNYIALLRWLLISSGTHIINALGYTAIHNKTEVLVAGRGIIQIIYTCLGLGIISFFSAFVIAYPKPLKPKLTFLISGIVIIELLNLVRLVVLALFWNRHKNNVIDHHIIFNIFIYAVILISLYFWVTAKKVKNAAN